jgi:hypothetical protein
MSEGAARFEKACREWQTKLGLLDWSFRFEAIKGDSTKHAEVNMDHDAREAIFTFYTRGQHDYSPERLALHECLHVLLVETLEAAVLRANIDHRDVAREEHRAIERLVNVLDGRQ